MTQSREITCMGGPVGNRMLRELALVAALAATGCLDQGSTLPPDNPNPDLSPGFHGLVMNWTANYSGDTVIEFRFTSPADNVCDVSGGGMGSTDTGAWFQIIAENELGFGASGGTSGNQASAHLAGTDTRSGNTTYAVGSGWGGGPPPPVVTLLGPGLQASHPGFIQNGTIGLSVKCTKPFNATATIGHTLLMATAANLAGGTGFETPVVDVNHQDVAAATLVSPRSRATYIQLGDLVANIELEHPTGTTTWMLPDGSVGGPGPRVIVTDGPGEYRFTVTKVSTGSAIVAAWGLDENLVLDPGLRESAIFGT